MSQVSFLLQYFRRPWMIAPIVEALHSCSEVATELVVNVDSPGDNQVRGKGAGRRGGVGQKGRRGRRVF